MQPRRGDWFRGQLVAIDHTEPAFICMYDVCSVGTIDEKSIQKVRVAKDERDCLLEDKMIGKYSFTTPALYIYNLLLHTHPLTIHCASMSRQLSFVSKLCKMLSANMKVGSDEWMNEIDG